MAFTWGTLPLISYAFGAKNYNRLVHVSLSCFIICFGLCLIFSSIFIFFPKQIASLWSSDSKYLFNAEQDIPPTFYLGMAWSVELVVCVILEGMKLILLSTFQSIIASLIPIPIISSILYFTDKKNPNRIYWTFFIVTSGVVLFHFYSWLNQFASGTKLKNENSENHFYRVEESLTSLIESHIQN